MTSCASDGLPVALCHDKTAGHLVLSSWKMFPVREPRFSRLCSCNCTWDFVWEQQGSCDSFTHQKRDVSYRAMQ